MANDYYARLKDYGAGTKARGSDVKSDFDGVVDGFDLIPTRAQFASGSINYVVAGGTADAITYTSPVTAWTTYTGKDGYKITFKASGTNTGAVTINADGLGPASAVRNDGTELDAGNLVGDGIYDANYNESTGKFVLGAAGITPSATVSDGDKGDIVVSGGGTAYTIDALAVDEGKIADNAVTLAKMANMATASFLGRTTAATGDPEVLSKTQARGVLDYNLSDLGLSGYETNGLQTLYSSDLDLILTNSTYNFINTGVTNEPSDMGSGLASITTFMYSIDTTFATQVIHGMSATSKYLMWVRTRGAGVWSPWTSAIDLDDYIPRSDIEAEVVLSQFDGADNWIKFIGGRIIQSGGQATSPAGVTVTFPLAFPTACRVVVISLNQDASVAVDLIATTYTTTNFLAKSPSGTYSAVWIAIGD